LLAWYGGQEMGNAIADVLFGKANPSGKLSETFPMRLEDNPAYINYPGENGKVYYGEGIFVGYRYYEKKKVAPLFPFGYGLSYTDFAYSNLTVSGSGTDVTVTVDIRNIGNRAGQEVVQLYLRDPQSKLVRPEKELKAFAKVGLDAGETKTVTLSLKHDAFAYYDPAKKAWVAEAGDFEILLGSSSADIRLSAVYELGETSSL
jgi:beta-glucosidase